MDKTVEMSSRFFNLFPHLIVAVQVENIRHQIESILVVLHLSVEASEVETVGKIIFIDFAKILITAR